MAQKGAGVVVLAEPTLNRQRIIDYLWKIRARNAVIVASNPTIAWDVKLALPNIEVAYRHPEDGNKDFDWISNPAAWWAERRNRYQHGVLAYVMNEPNGYQDLRHAAKQLSTIVKIANNEGVKTVVGNFGVGHPDELRIGNGELDELFVTLMNAPGNYLGLHEYYVSSVLEEIPYYTGRFSYARVRELYLRQSLQQTLDIWITETGRDLGGGANDGWNSFYDGDAGRYIEQLKELDSLYASSGMHYSIFCAGAGYGWGNFDIMNNEQITQHLLMVNTGNPSTPVPPTVGTHISDMNGPFVNIRSRPHVSGTDVGDAVLGDQIEILGDPINGYLPIRRLRDHLLGWMYLQDGKVKVSGS